MDRLFLENEWAASHAAGGGNGRQEGRERGYYNLHRNLHNPIRLHTHLLFTSESLMAFRAHTGDWHQCAICDGTVRACPHVCSASTSVSLCPIRHHHLPYRY